MKRVLCIISSLNAGGAETFLMKLYRSLDPQKYQLDFVVSEKEKGFYSDEVEKRGGKIFYVPTRTSQPVLAFGQLKGIIRENSYKHVLKLCDTPIGIIDVLAAKLGGATLVSVRSCNASSYETFARKLLCGFLRPLFNLLINQKIAPSDLAAEYTFGKRVVKKGQVAFLHNAVDLNVYHYDVGIRENIRKEFGIEGKTVIGHIGRFNTQKNHAFLLDVFAEIRKKQPDAVLMLVGTGELEDEIRQKAERLGLTKHIIFTGVRSDVPQLLSAMDVFVFPSFYEGMPNTVIEAEATGLPAVIADTITKEADITGLVRYLPLEYSAETWAEQSLSLISSERKDTKQDFIDHQYDIKSATKEFVQLVFGEE